MLKKDLAEALGISATMVTKLSQRGMPLDSVAAARRWRDANLDSGRRKEYRAPQRQRGAVGAQSPDAAEWPDSVDMFVSAALFAERWGLERYGPLLPHLGSVMSDANLRAALADPALPPAVATGWDALCDAWEACFRHASVDAAAED